mgnify:CR=1 FL=1
MLGCPGRAGGGWLGLVCADLAGLGFVMLHKYSLADLVIIQGKAINFERFFLDIAHKVRYNNTRVKEIVNPLQLTASPLLGGGWTEERNQLINLKGDRQNET